MAEGKKVGSIYIDLGMKADTFSKGLAKAEGAMRSFGTKIKSGLNALRNFIFSWKTLVVAALAAAFTGKAIGGIKSLVRGVIDASNTYEQLRLTLKVLLKDQNKANKAFAEAEELAAKTAFSIEEVTRGYTSLLVFGFDQTKIPETLLLAADAASAFGQNLDEVIRALSYLKAGRKGEALESLARFGISRTELVKRGASFSAGGELETDTEKLFAIIESIWGDTVKGMSVEGTKTWKGMISNLGDAWVKFKASIGEAGFFDAVKEKLNWILRKIDEWSQNGQLKKWADDISKYMTDTFNGVVAVIAKITGVEIDTTYKPNANKSVEELGRMLGMDETQIKNAAMLMAQGFTDEFLKTAEAQKIGADVVKILDLAGAVEGGGEDALSPFWQRIIDGIEKGNFKTRLTTAISSVVSTLATDEKINKAVYDAGYAIGKGLITGMEGALLESTTNLDAWFDNSFIGKIERKFRIWLNEHELRY